MKRPHLVNQRENDTGDFWYTVRGGNGSNLLTSEAERWRAIPGWEGLYEVSDLGRVRSLDRLGRRQKHTGRVLKPQVVSQKKYLGVGLHVDRRVRQAYVHTLVLEAFIGPRPRGHEARHLNGRNQDNRLSNLQWGTPTENAADKVRHGTATRQVLAAECQRGHAFNDANTVIGSDGARRCRTCSRDRSRESMQRRRDRLRKQRDAA